MEEALEDSMEASLAFIQGLADSLRASDLASPGSIPDFGRSSAGEFSIPASSAMASG